MTRDEMVGPVTVLTIRRRRHWCDSPRSHVGFVAVLLWVMLAQSTVAYAAEFKAIQSGATSSSGDGTVTVTISSVDTTKAFLIFQTRHNSNRTVGSMVRGRIATSTTLQFTRVTDETSTMQIQWYVVEFSSVRLEECGFEDLFPLRHGMATVARGGSPCHGLCDNSIGAM